MLFNRNGVKKNKREKKITDIVSTCNEEIEDSSLQLPSSPMTWKLKTETKNGGLAYLQHTKILIGFNTSSDDRRTLFPT
jgi:hypothetical protein